MPLKAASRVKEIASNKPNAATAFSLPNSAAAGFQSFGAAFASGDIVPYFATNGSAWESGLGTFTAGTPDTLARTTVLESSTGSAIDWSGGGDVTVFVEHSAKFTEWWGSVGFVSVGSDGVTAQSFTSATSTKVSGALATEVTDELGWWDHTNKKFQPTRAGIYLIQAWVQFNGIGAGVYQASLSKNGTSEVGGPTTHLSGTAYPSIMVIGSIRLNGTTDYVEFYAYTESAGNSLAGAGAVGFKARWEAP